MRRMTTEELLQTRLQTLENDFTQRFGENTDTDLFKKSLTAISVPNGILSEEASKSRFGRTLQVVYKHFNDLWKTLETDSEQENDTKFMTLLIRVMALERILSADKMRGRGKGSVDEVFLDSQMFERIDAVSSYVRTTKEMGLELVDREALGWGFGGTGKGTFTKGAFLLVQKYARLLEKSDRLLALAEKIGRHSAKKQKRIVADGNKPSVSYDGIYNSDNIRTILPSELALSANPRTRTEFLRRLADRQVLCYKPAPDKSAADGNDKDKGPVVICLDTSGSMHGAPEALSKAIVLNIIKNATKEKREILVISFSITFETLKIKNPEKADEMQEIIDFLSSSFHGGTDIASAIDHALSISPSGLSSADVLIISDFVSQELSKNTIKAIDKAKRHGTRFFAIAVGERGNNQILRLMDETEIISRSWESVKLEF